MNNPRADEFEKLRQLAQHTVDVSSGMTAQRDLLRAALILCSNSLTGSLRDRIRAREVAEDALSKVGES